MSLEKPKVFSTKGDIEEFKKSILWKDFRRELLAWKKGFDNEMKAIVDNAASDNPSTASVLLHLGDLNGRVKAVDYFLSMPDTLIGIVEDQQNDLERERAERPEASE